MKKTYKYTIIAVFLAAVFSLGSVEGMNLILHWREHQLLYTGREIVAESVGDGWQERDNIPADTIVEVMQNWEDRMTVHAPVNGQLSMQDAVKTAKAWLTQMELESYDWERNVDSQMGSVFAALGTMAKPEEVQEKPYYSFWKVQLSSRSLEAVLYVNAVTAGIWKSEIKIYESLPDDMPYWKLRNFLEFNKLTPYHKGAVCNKGRTRAVWEEENSRLCARMEFARYEGSGYRKDLSDFDRELVGPNGIQRKSVVMTMRLGVRHEAQGNEKP